MTHLTRRTLIKGTSAGVTLAAIGGSSAAFAQDDKPTVKVGSTNYTEQFILAEMLSLLLEDNGFPVETEHNLGGTFVIHEARNNGDIDAHVEYTGSALTILEMNVSDVREEDSSPQEVVDLVYDVVKEEYEKQFEAIWLDPIGINNTYALAMRRADAEELGFVTISDLKDHAADLVLGGSQEFLVREDGLPGIEELYDIEFKDSKGMESGLMYAALDGGDVDVISAFATDGRIPAMDFVLLEDDLGFFPPYYASPVVRADLFEKAPEAKDILNKLAGQLDNTTMANLNFRVDDGGEEFRDVARNFLTEKELIPSGN